MEGNQTGIYVKILDKELQVACPQGSESELSEAASYLDQKMQAIKSAGKIVGVDRIAIMAALNITHEMMAEQKQNDDYIKHIDDRISVLASKLEEATKLVEDSKDNIVETNIFD